MPKAPPETQAVKETGAVRIYGILRDEILRMRLSPGTALDEIGLAERFNMSRSPIREALVRLSGDGLVQILPNRSTIVTPMDYRRVPEFLDALDLLQRVTTRLAALHRTSADLLEIREKQKAYEKAIANSIKSYDSLGMIDKNYEFHMAIAKAGRNVYFADLYRRLLDEGRRMLHLHFEYEALGTELSVEKMAGGHADIVDAIEARDADRAEEAAHEHAMQFRGRFMQFLNRNLTAAMPLNIQSADAEQTVP
ncbi:GntR family transcriptional regulator [Paraburkholderia sp. BR13439]|uniref:GntR family transcriptional regulator n=1 Tax=unclassified Paraburkholderia TaxID=2615204 RepID=UPI0034CD109B